MSAIVPDKPQARPEATPRAPASAVSDPVAPGEQRIHLPWSIATIVGWSALALGTVAAIVIVIVAVTQ